jgi:two-component system sensor histidine kinase UhpB
VTSPTSQLRSRPSAQERVPGHVPLFWRLFVPNAAVLLGACVVLVIEPANGRIIALAGGLFIMLTVNVVLMRRAFAPLRRLTTLMGEIDPLNPGRRLPVLGPRSEVSDLATAFNDMLDRLEKERRESAYKALMAQEAERRRVALELHDEIGQQLTAQMLTLNRMVRNPPTSDELEAATAAAKQTLEDVRQIARRLRPEVLDHLGLVPALRNLCDRIADGTELVVRRSLPAEMPPVGADAELVIYRVAQESLTNAVRHAGADAAEVRLELIGQQLRLTVSDDGVGLPVDAAAASGGGLRWMRERALLIDGHLEVDSGAAGGTEIRLDVPCQGSMSPRRTA